SAVLDGGDELGQELGWHLTVAVDLYDDRSAGIDRCTISGDHRTADTLVLVVPNDTNSRIVGFLLDEQRSTLRTAVIDHEYVSTFRTDALKNSKDVARDLVTRDHYGDRLVGRHCHRRCDRLEDSFITLDSFAVTRRVHQRILRESNWGANGNKVS